MRGTWSYGGGSTNNVDVRFAKLARRFQSTESCRSIPPVTFTSAFYIKLGRGGAWEPDSIQTGKLRLGGPRQSVEDINAGRWKVIERQLRSEHKSTPQVATTDL